MGHFYTYRAEVVHVVDGDTYDFEIDLGFNITKEIRVRLRGADTNEVYGVKKESEEYKKGKEQSEFVKEILFSADEIVLQTYKDSTGKYGRYIASVDVDGDSLSSLILEEFPELTARETYGLLTEQKKNELH